MNRHLLVPLLFLALLLLLGIGLTLNPRLIPSPFVGKPLPAFDLPRLDAPESRFTERDLRGRAVLLNVWASWCIACGNEHNELMQLAQQHAVPIIGLNYKDRREDALAWLERHGNPYEISVQDQDGRAGIELGVYGVPETFMIDTTGVVRHKHVGPLDAETIERVILPLLAEHGAEHPAG
jgi:cytochrome c biogenesis protein CcmG/thiol:disulfide interchange protein DsbE